MIRITTISLLVLLLFGGTIVSLADDDHERARELLLNGKIVPVETLLKQVWESVPSGRLLELEFEKEKGRYVYEVVVVDADGTVWELYFDAQSGELIKKSLED